MHQAVENALSGNDFFIFFLKDAHCQARKSTPRAYPQDNSAYSTVVENVVTTYKTYEQRCISQMRIGELQAAAKRRFWATVGYGGQS
jgi:hypothetical protein